MLTTTLAYLKCPNPHCANTSKKSDQTSKQGFSLQKEKSIPLSSSGSRMEILEVVSGSLTCNRCHEEYPIVRGIAVLVPDVEDYFLAHVKGISRWVPDAEIPKKFRRNFQEAKREIEVEHIEEDLEAERVTSLYVMNHYLQVRKDSTWWSAGSKDASPEITEIVKRFWDHGPFAKIREFWGSQPRSVVELGCGVGGLYVHLADRVSQYLGVDSSFASIALARKLALGLPSGLESSEKVMVPGDLLNGAVSLNVRNQIGKFPAPGQSSRADFVVGDAVHPPLLDGQWDVSASLNMIDMLDEPAILPELQKRLVKPGGLAIQSSPYVWHPAAAFSVKKQTGENDSARAVEKLYELKGFQIKKSAAHVPWLFFKHVRQLEIYSVHMFFAAKSPHLK